MAKLRGLKKAELVESPDKRARTSEGWRDIGHTNVLIRNSLMRKTGLLPLVDYIVLLPMTGSIVVLVLNRRKIREQLREKFNLGGED